MAEPKRGGPRYGTDRGVPTPAAPAGVQLAVVVATTGQLRADVAGNRTFLTGFIKDFAAC